MATTKPKVDDTLPTINDEEEVDDLPEEFTGTGSTPTKTPSLSDLNDMDIDDSSMDKDTARLTAPTGDWEKITKWEYTGKRVNEDDSLPGDVDPNGRTYFNIKGQPKARVKGDIEYQPTLFVNISPDKRFKKDGDGRATDQFDNAYKLWLKARELYTNINSEKPRKYGQVVAMLCEEDYLVRTMNGDNGPIVLDVKAKKQGR